MIVVQVAEGLGGDVVPVVQRADDAEIAVIGILAEALIGDDHEIGVGVLDDADSARDDAILGIVFRAARVTMFRQAEEYYHRDIQLGELSRFGGPVVDR